MRNMMFNRQIENDDDVIEEDRRVSPIYLGKHSSILDDLPNEE